MVRDALAIRVEGLAKQYEIVALKRGRDNLRERFSDAVKSTFRRGADRGGAQKFWALRDVSFRIERGESVGVIGSNGAGKSTLLRILSRITTPTQGFAEIHGRVGSLLEVGTGFHPELTGRENIYLNGAILGMSRAEIQSKFDRIVDFAEVEKFIDLPVKRYSSGMYVRLAFAVAAHLDPEILIVDEVLSVGDLAFQRKCLGRMGTAAREGRTVLFVSHNLAAVKSLCTRGLLLDNGRLEMDGTSEAVVGRYIALHEEALSGERRHRIESDPTWKDTSRGFFLYPRGERAEMAVDCGDDIVLEFEVESPKDLEEATVGIVVVTTAGEKIASMSSKVQNVASAPGPSRRWSVRCDMGRLPLNAGIYRLHVYFGNGGFDFARFTSALAIKVREHDVFGWGNPLPPVESWGSIYWEPRWEIAPARRAAVFTAASPLVEVE